MTKIFRERERAKRVDTGEQVTVVQTMPLGQRVFYRIESENGDTTVVLDAKLREVYA